MLYVKREKVFSQEYFGQLMKMIVMAVVLAGLIYGVFYVDRILKSDFQEQKLSQSKATKAPQPLPEIDNSSILLPLILVFISIMTWCFYLKFVTVFMRRKRLIWAEVQDKKDPENDISRNQSKLNLHMVNETTKKTTTDS